MHATTLTLPDRDTKPRTAGITMVIDTGLPTHYFSDIVSSFSGLIDVIKLGWGTSLVTDDLKYKIDALKDARVDYYFGGTLFEKFVSQDRFDDWRRFVDRFELSPRRDLERDDRHDQQREGRLHPADRAGLHRVQRGRLQGVGPLGDDGPADLDRLHRTRTSPPAPPRSSPRRARAARAASAARTASCKLDLIEHIADSGIDLNRLLFEAPNKDLQVTLIRRFGAQVNLGNIAADRRHRARDAAAGPARRHPARLGRLTAGADA